MNRATRQAALALTRRGYVVIPKQGKKPALKGWKTAKHATPAEIAGWTAENIAIRTGRDSGNLIVLDCDGLPAYAAFRAAFPDLVDTWTVASGSGKGMHIYFTTELLPLKTRAMKISALDNANLELMVEGDSVVAPPSIHPDTGNLYTVSHAAAVRHLTADETGQLVNWINSFKPVPAPAPVIVPRSGNSQGQGKIDRDRLKADIFARLVNAYHWKHSGEGYAGRIPWREDKKSSGGITLRTGTLTDFATGEKWELIEVAERIGVNIDDYRDQPAPRPTVRRELGLSSTLPNNRPPEPVKTEPLPDGVIFEIANSFTAAAGMVARLIDSLPLADEWTARDLITAMHQAGQPMTPATVYRALDVLTGVRIELFSKNQTVKEDNPPSDNLRIIRRPASNYRVLPLPACLEALKAATMTRLVKVAYPESDKTAALPAISAKMLTDTLDTGEDIAAIVTALNQVMPLPERSRDRSQSVYLDCVKKYRTIVKTLTDNTITRLDPAALPDRARSNPNAYLDVLRLERIKQRDGQNVSGKAIGATIGIYDPRQRSRKLRALGIIRHENTFHRDVDSLAAVDREARRNCAHPIKLVAINRAGDETAFSSIDSGRAADFITTQRAAGYRVMVKLQAASRIEVSTPPEREPVERKPEIVQFSSKNQPVSQPVERAEELPGRYTDHWLKFHLLRRLHRDARGFYTNPATGEIIPQDLTGSLPELIEALTGYRLTQREEETA